MGKFFDLCDGFVKGGLELRKRIWIRGFAFQVRMTEPIRQRESPFIGQQDTLFDMHRNGPRAR